MHDALPIFIKPADLHAIMDDTGVQIVAVDTAPDFAKAHIPGALQIAMADIMTSDGPTGGLIPDDAALAARLSRAGMANNAHIVVYDRAGDGQAARLCYTLDAAGHDAFSLLDGGLAAWHAAGLPLEAGDANPESGDFHIAHRPDVVADRAWITARLDASETTLLDVRSAAEYAGDDIRSAHGGHIPAAVNLDWEMFKDDNGQLRDWDTLRELLAEHRVDRANEVVAYCQTHVRSSYVYLVLKALGYEHVRGYPGAWSDWGNRDDTRIEDGH